MPSPTHPEHEQEQAYIERVHRAFEAGRERSLRGAENAVDKYSAREMRKQMLERHGHPVDVEALCFGRIDLQTGRTHYLGRGAVHDDENALLVIDWRRPVAEGFYNATRSDPRGLTGRRRFQLDGARLLGIVEDAFGVAAKPLTPSRSPVAPKLPPPSEGPPARPEPEPEAEAIEPQATDAILADMDRSRTPEMRDIVATIEARQYELISADIDGIRVIQGGPGSGKTAVALHRAAWLLYNHRDELSRSGVLVVGPNRAFMEYVRGVLPALGEAAVTQVVVDRLPAFNEVRVRGSDQPAVARLKSDLRMSSVIAHAVGVRVRPPKEDMTLTDGRQRIVLRAEDVNALIARAWDEEETYNAARERFRAGLTALVQEAAAAGARGLSLTSVVDADDGPLTRIWPTVTAPEVLRDLFNSRQRLDASASGLTADERASLRRPRSRLLREEPWTRADMALLDEADAAIRGTARTYGYVLADEAQDLSPMQLRMVLRRVGGERATLVGDIAQATGPIRFGTWSELLAAAGAPAPTRVDELLLGYRVPKQITALAAELLPRIAPQVTMPTAVRQGTSEPELIQTQTESEMAAALVDAVSRRVEADRSVGVIAASDRAELVRAALAQAGLQIGEVLKDGLERQVTLLSAEQAKGLEFDHVVVLDPAGIAGPEGDWAYVYIALTRATRTLAVIHCTAEPFELPPPDEPEADEAGPLLPELPVAEEVAEGVLLGARYTEALMQAKFLHTGQRRRGTLVPYFAHLQAVAAIVLEDGGTEDEAIAALLHDAVEDYGAAQLDQIMRHFGRSVAQIVAAVTDPELEEGGSWRSIKIEHLRSLELAGAQARRVALAEKLDNARALLRDYRASGEAIWERMAVDGEDILWYFAELADLFDTERPGDMAFELTDTVDRLLELASQPD